jgi:hypothetical protein
MCIFYRTFTECILCNFQNFIQILGNSMHNGAEKSHWRPSRQHSRSNCYWERSKNFDTWFVVTSQNATKCMFSESTCLKTNFGTYLELLVQAVAEKSLGKEGQFRTFFAFPAIHAFTKIAITFDRLHRFYRIIACFKGHSISVYSTFLEILNFTLLKIFKWSKFAQILKWNFSRISMRIFLKILSW